MTQAIRHQLTVHVWENWMCSRDHLDQTVFWPDNHSWCKCMSTHTLLVFALIASGDDSLASDLIKSWPAFSVCGDRDHCLGGDALQIIVTTEYMEDITVLCRILERKIEWIHIQVLCCMFAIQDCCVEVLFCMRVHRGQTQNFYLVSLFCITVFILTWREIYLIGFKQNLKEVTNLNQSKAKATLVQSTMTQRYLKLI